MNTHQPDEGPNQTRAAEAPAPVIDLEPLERHETEDLDEIVLPWWQHPLNIVTLLVATALVAGMIGWLVADAASEPDANEVDIGFLQDMREHHEQAVVMSFIYLGTEAAQVGLSTVARSIAFGQAIDIGRMIQMLRDFGAAEVNEGDTSMTWMGMSAAVGSMPGMASQEQLDQLAAAQGDEAARLFVELMTAHHRGGVEMAAYAAANAESAEVRDMAASIVGAQQSEIRELQSLLPGG